MTHRACILGSMLLILTGVAGAGELVGFDGIGNGIGHPYAGEDFFEPSVILRMADGSKRSFQSKTFCQADREFILDVYVKEMKRITGTLDQTAYSVRPQTVNAYPGGTSIGEPGSLLLQSKHFVVPSGSQAPGGDNDRWLNDKKPEVAARLRECGFNMFEHMRAGIRRANPDATETEVHEMYVDRLPRHHGTSLAEVRRNQAEASLDRAGPGLRGCSYPPRRRRR